MARRPKAAKARRAKPARRAASITGARAVRKTRPRTAQGLSLAPKRAGIASARGTIGMLDDEAAQMLARRCRDAALGKKAEDVVMLDIRKLANFADYFVIATGRSLIQARAVADAIVEACEEQYGSPVRVEGYSEGGWILVDYGAVIAHVFLPQSREFYNLERLWGKPTTAAKRTP